MVRKSVYAFLRDVVCLGVCACHMTLSNDQMPKISSADSKAINFTVENKNQVLVNNGIYDGDCTRLSGKYLHKCMACLDPQQLKTNFMKLNSRAALYFWQGLKTKEEKLEFLHHISDEEWHARWKELSPEMQKKIVSTKQEQLKSLEENKLANLGWGMMCIGVKIAGTYFLGPAGLLM